MTALESPIWEVVEPGFEPGWPSIPSPPVSITAPQNCLTGDSRDTALTTLSLFLLLLLWFALIICLCVWLVDGFA